MGRLIRQAGGGGRLLQRARIDPVILDFGMGSAQPLSKSG